MIDQVELDEWRCQACRKPLQQTRGHRPRQYCNDACRQAGHRRKQREEQSEAQPVSLRLDRAHLEAKFMALGELLQYRSLLMIPVMGSLDYWQSFMERADTETLAKAVAAAEAFYENLTASRFEQYQARIAELEEENRKLKEQIAQVPAKKAKKAAPEASPLPPEYVYWRHFANTHNVRQNDVSDAVKQGAIDLVRGNWKLENGYLITESLGPQGQQDFWIQFHQRDGFRACDACPHHR